MTALAETIRASWTNGHESLPFPGDVNDSRGFACYQYDAQLEDGETYPQVLETHPEWRDWDGSVKGKFRIGILGENATFKSQSGFLKGATQTDGAEFKVYVTRDPSLYASKKCFYDGRLDELVFDLKKYAGEDIELVLEVHVIGNSIQDWAVWVNPRIEW